MIAIFCTQIDGETVWKRFGSASRPFWSPTHALLIGFILASIGCGTTKTYMATEQLLMSNAVDATIAKMNFSALTGRKVYLDTNSINKARIPGQSLIVDANYMLSALRQQMVADGVLLVEKMTDAEIVAEPRIGALGIDAHDLIYGIPASNSISTMGSAVTGNSLIPPIPEIALARREDKLGAAKIAVFAYDRQTREPFWQSGIAQSNSNSKATWIFGVGPFQQGTIHEGTQFAGEGVFTQNVAKSRHDQASIEQFASSHLFHRVDDPSNSPESSATSTEGSDSSVAATDSTPAGREVVSASHQESLSQR